MLALAYSFGLFAIWTILGRALFALSAPRFGALRSWLLAPAVGLAVMLFGLMVGNQLGWPIGRFAQTLTISFVVLAVIVLWRTRPGLPGRALAPFLGAAVFSLLWTGWPALQVGFNWISYGNDDMANYCLAAERFADHGFFAVPTLAELAGRDYAAYYYFMHVADMMRFGSEHIVAWAASLIRVRATEAFMPAILALALTQLSAAAGLALQHGRHRRVAVVTAWLLAASPLFMLGTLYQLIAQVGGIALLLVTLALMTRPFGAIRRATLLRFSILPATTGAALCIYYPEATPFAVLAYFGYTALALLRRRRRATVAIALTAYVLVGVIVLLRYNLVSYLFTLANQFGTVGSAGNLLLSLFPYFLLPTGFANLFGWMPIARDFADPIVSASIALGMLVALALLVRAVREAWQLRATAILLLVHALLAVDLYRSGNDFGLYKLAMFMQPVLAAGLAGLLLLIARRRLAVAAGCIAGFALTTAPTAISYTRASQGTQSGGLTELRFGSELGMHIAPPANPNAQITAAIENVVAAKFAASELRGHPLALPSRDYFFPNTRTDYGKPPLAVRLHPHFTEMAQARPLIEARNTTQVKTSMLWLTEFSQPVLHRPTDNYLSFGTRLSLFNKFGRDLAAPMREVFVVEPAASVHNELIFVHSGLGNHYYLGDRRKISFFQQEPDLFAKGRDFNGIGRFMLLRIEQPDDEIYLRIAATKTAVPNRTAWNPDAVVHGATDLPLGAVGNGACNLFVGPLRPMMFEGAAYVAIDYKDYPYIIQDRRPGLKRLYNRDVPLDSRRLLGWGRDFSALSVAQYQALRRPLRVTRFPEDLATAETLEFSGIYEDGWISPQSKFVLGSSGAHGVLRLKGFVPALGGSQLGTGNLKLTVEDRTIEVPAGQGDFDWLVPISRTRDATHVGLAFNVSAKLPGGDNRPIAAKLQLLEILSALPAQTFDFSTIGAPRLAGHGIDGDGWLTRHGTIEIPALDAPTQLDLRLEIPGWAATKQTKIRVYVDGTNAALEQTLAPGYATLKLAVPASASPRTLHIEADATFALPAPDTRQRCGRVLEFSLHPNS